MTIKRFEELEIWQKARELCKKIRLIADSTSLSKDFGLRNQILDSSGSVMDNIAEGFERDGKKEFLNFLYYSKGSLGETRSQVHRIFDSGYITEEKYAELIEDCLNLSGQIKGFINYLGGSEYQGLKKK
ncbi:MAG: four helix bundle protein [Bacteroidales bacterium]|nr:four helix bundle protein [Bacteroidales bacterium]